MKYDKSFNANILQCSGWETQNCLQVFVFFNPVRSTKNQHVFALTCWKSIKINVVFSLLSSKNRPRLWKMSLGREFYPSLTLLWSLCVIEHFLSQASASSWAPCSWPWWGLRCCARRRWRSTTPWGGSLRHRRPTPQSLWASSVDTSDIVLNIAVYLIWILNIVVG